jgi:hypothetical protein
MHSIQIIILCMNAISQSTSDPLSFINPTLSLRGNVGFLVPVNQAVDIYSQLVPVDEDALYIPAWCEVGLDVEFFRRVVIMRLAPYFETGITSASHMFWGFGFSTGFELHIAPHARADPFICFPMTFTAMNCAQDDGFGFKIGAGIGMSLPLGSSQTVSIAPALSFVNDSWYFHHGDAWGNYTGFDVSTTGIAGEAVINIDLVREKQ